MSIETILNFISEILGVCLPIILGYFIWILKEERNERKANTLGMKEILGYMIDRWYNEIMLQGYITTDQRNTIDGIFLAYAANKGNGARKSKYEELKKIKIDDSKPNTSIYYNMVKEYTENKKCEKKGE